MIFDYFSSDDPQIRMGLEKIDSLLTGNNFLGALGGDFSEATSLSNFPVVMDIDKACKLMTSQEMWDLPEPWPFQYFSGIVGDEASRLEYETGLENSIRTELSRQYQRNLGDFSEACFSLIQKNYEVYGVRNFLKQHSTSEDFEFIVFDVFPNEIQAYLQSMIAGTYFGYGLDNSPILNRMYDAFMTGGIPCGWVGPLPEDSGDPVECLQLLHFDKTSIIA